eukprot:1184738-Prorocentrum_minimum.AAC.1
MEYSKAARLFRLVATSGCSGPRRSARTECAHSHRGIASSCFPRRLRRIARVFRAVASAMGSGFSLCRILSRFILASSAAASPKYACLQVGQTSPPGLPKLSCHCLRHVRWIQPAEPRHAQGLTRASLCVATSRQILQRAPSSCS